MSPAQTGLETVEKERKGQIYKLLWEGDVVQLVECLLTMQEAVFILSMALTGYVGDAVHCHPNQGEGDKKI